MGDTHGYQISHGSTAGEQALSFVTVSDHRTQPAHHQPFELRRRRRRSPGRYVYVEGRSNQVCKGPGGRRRRSDVAELARMSVVADALNDFPAFVKQLLQRFTCKRKPGLKVCDRWAAS